MQANTDIIIFSLFKWDAEISSSALALAKEFSKNNRVFYINHPYSVFDLVKNMSDKRIKSRMKSLISGRTVFESIPFYEENLVAVTPSLSLPINFLPAGKLYQFFSSLNNRIITKTLKKIIRDYQIKKYIFLNCFDPFFFRDLPDSCKPELKIYYSMDDITQVKYTAKHGSQLETEIIQKYDLTMTTSRELYRLKKEISSHVYYLPNAADIDLFLTSTDEKLIPPEDWVFAGKKTIAYLGAIESRIDYQLLHKIAKDHHDKLIILIGPIVSREYREMKLDKMDNVIFLGGKKMEELPAYLKFMDVALIPFKKNVLTKSIYPLKINEYLAAGKAVVSTDFSEDILAFEPIIYIGRDEADFSNKIDLAIHENNQQKIKERIEVAKENSWEARVKQFWKILEDYATL